MRWESSTYGAVMDPTSDRLLFITIIHTYIFIHSFYGGIKQRMFKTLLCKEMNVISCQFLVNMHNNMIIIL